MRTFADVSCSYLNAVQSHQKLRTTCCQEPDGKKSHCLLRESKWQLWRQSCLDLAGAMSTSLKGGLLAQVEKCDLKYLVGHFFMHNLYSICNIHVEILKCGYVCLWIRMTKDIHSTITMHSFHSVSVSIKNVPSQAPLPQFWMNKCLIDTLSTSTSDMIFHFSLS